MHDQSCVQLGFSLEREGMPGQHAGHVHVNGLRRGRQMQTLQMQRNGEVQWERHAGKKGDHAIAQALLLES